MSDQIAFDDFCKVDLRVGTVTAAAPVEKSKKLLQLTVDAGEAAPRTILASLKATHDPAALVGTQVVFVANIPEAQIAGLTSQGMVLAVNALDGLGLIRPDRLAAPGTKVS